MNTPHRAVPAWMIIGLALAFRGVAPTEAKEYLEVQPLSVARDLHGAVVVGERLYVLGGRTVFGFTSAVHSTPISPDGSLGSWTQNTALPLKLAGLQNSVVATEQAIYVCGGRIVEELPGPPAGRTKEFDNPSVYYARVGADGSLSAWTRSTSWPGRATLGVAAATDGRCLYVTGGMDSTFKATASTAFAQFLPDGSLGPWSPGPSLPAPLAGHACFLIDGVLYVAGGRGDATPASTSGSVYRAAIGDDGMLQAWESDDASLVVPSHAAAQCRLGNHLFLFGGHSSLSEPLGMVQYSRIVEGRLLAWQTFITDMPTRLDAAAAPDLDRDALYLTGGRSLDSLYSLTDRALRFLLPENTPAPPFSGLTALPTQQSASRFHDIQTAFAMAQKSNRYIFLFCLSPVSADARDAWNYQLNRPQFLAGIPANVIPAYLDIQAQPQVARSLGVFKVPAYAMFNTQGRPLALIIEPLTPEEILTFIRYYAK